MENFLKFSGGYTERNIIPKVKEEGRSCKRITGKIRDNIAAYKSYILMDVLVPAIKKALSGIVKDGIDMILYGETNRSRKNGAPSRINYRGYYERENDRRDRTPGRGRDSLDYGEKTVDEKGKEKTTKKTVNVAGPLGHSDYARFFDESSRNWEKNGEYNLMFLRAQQARANEMLRSRGYLFLSEVYQMLDLREDEASRVVGWVYDRGSAPVGDNYVDFGITEVDREAQEHPDEEPERTIILNFNVDGYILKHFMKFDTTH